MSETERMTGDLGGMPADVGPGDSVLVPNLDAERVALEDEEDPVIVDLRTQLLDRVDDPGRNADLGLALAEVGRPLEAIPYLRRASELQPTSARAQYNLGVGYLMTLQADAESKADWAEDHYDSQAHYFAAQQAFQTALQLDPSLAEAQRNLDLLSDLDLSSL